MNLLQLRKLIYDEVVKCNRCGFCLPNCPIYLVEKKEWASPRGRNALTRAVLEGQLEWSKEIEQSIFSCLGCGACTAACFPSIKTRDVVFHDRACLVNQSLHPEVASRLAKYIEESHNITNDDNQERGEWRELIGNVPEDYLEKDRAEFIYFVGCVASFFPLAQKIPAAMAGLLERAGVDFTILGGDEWCCGYPLVGAGMPEKINALVEHNVAKVRDVGAKALIFTCPSCLHTWKSIYPQEVELVSSSEFLLELIASGRLRPTGLDIKITYHDPCDLGRNTGIFEQPRELIKSIPGVTLVELPNNRNFSVCCGGGGNLEMVNPDLAAQVAQIKIDEILSTGADMVVTSCQQCLRTIATRARRQKIPLEVIDLTQLLQRAFT